MLTGAALCGARRRATWTWHRTLQGEGLPVAAGHVLVAPLPALLLPRLVRSSMPRRAGDDCGNCR